MTEEESRVAKARHKEGTTIHTHTCARAGLTFESDAVGEREMEDVREMVGLSVAEGVMGMEPAGVGVRVAELGGVLDGESEAAEERGGKR